MCGHVQNVVKMFTQLVSGSVNVNFWISNVHLQCSVSGFSYICSLMCTAVVYHDTVMARLSPKM